MEGTTPLCGFFFPLSSSDSELELSDDPLRWLPPGCFYFSFIFLPYDFYMMMVILLRKDVCDGLKDRVSGQLTHKDLNRLFVRYAT